MGDTSDCDVVRVGTCIIKVATRILGKCDSLPAVVEGAGRILCDSQKKGARAHCPGRLQCFAYAITGCAVSFFTRLYTTSAT